MSGNWLFFPCLHLHLLLFGLYSHLSLSLSLSFSLSLLQTADSPNFFSFLSLVSQNPLGRDSHCWHLWHPPRSSFPEKWADVCACVCVYVFERVLFSVFMCMSQRVNLRDPCISVCVCEPVRLSVYAWLDILVSVCKIMYSLTCMCMYVHVYAFSQTYVGYICGGQR